jgi:hypothetical protein
VDSDATGRNTGVKTLLWQGHSVETVDEVADAAFELAQLLVGFGRVERIDVPAEIDGQATTASFVVGAGMGLGMLALPAHPDHDLPGTAAAAAELRDRIARLDDAPKGTDFRLPDDFSVLDHDIES